MVCREMNRKKSLKQILLLLCCYIAHSLHMWLAPVVRQYTVLLIGCPRFPKAACFQKFCGRSLARVCGSLIFSGFWNSVVLFAWPVGGWSIVGFVWHVSCFSNFRNWPSFHETFGRPSLAWGLGIFASVVISQSKDHDREL